MNFNETYLNESFFDNISDDLYSDEEYINNSGIIYNDFIIDTIKLLLKKHKFDIYEINDSGELFIDKYGQIIFGTHNKQYKVIYITLDHDDIWEKDSINNNVTIKFENLMDDIRCYKHII